MTASRVALAAVAADLLDNDRGEDTRRVASLRRALAGTVRAAVSVKDLGAVPAWLRQPAAARADLGRRAALLGIAPALASSVDGSWLGGLARAAGDAAVDAAIAAAPGAAMSLAVFDGAAADAVAASLLRAAAPPGLGDYAAAPRAAAPVEPATAAALVARAFAGR